MELKETGLRTKVITTQSPVSHIENPACPRCGGSLEVRKFVDSWDSEHKPCDINEDFYCPKCDIRWLEQAGPHDWFSE